MANNHREACLALRFLNWVISENGEGHLALKRALEIKVVGVRIPKPNHLEVKKQLLIIILHISQLCGPIG